MNYAVYCFCIAVDICAIIDFLKPLYKKKYLKDGFKLKLIAQIWNYIILLVAFSGAGYTLVMLIKERSVDNIVFFSMIFIITMFEVSKSYVFICKEGLFLDGIYFSNAEKQEGQYVNRIMLWHRRIYAIRTTRKFAYVYLRKKFIDDMVK